MYYVTSAALGTQGIEENASGEAEWASYLAYFENDRWANSAEKVRVFIRELRTFTLQFHLYLLYIAQEDQSAFSRALISFVNEQKRDDSTAETELQAFVM